MCVCVNTHIYTCICLYIHVCMAANWQVICPPPAPHSGARKRASCYNASS